jgi:hypothetical protein
MCYYEVPEGNFGLEEIRYSTFRMSGSYTICEVYSLLLRQEVVLFCRLCAEELLEGLRVTLRAASEFNPAKCMAARDAIRRSVEE